MRDEKRGRKECFVVARVASVDDDSDSFDQIETSTAISSSLHHHFIGQQLSTSIHDESRGPNRHYLPDESLHKS